MRISDWSSDVCSSDLSGAAGRGAALRRHADHGAVHCRGDRCAPGVGGAAGESGMTYLAKPKLHHPSLGCNAIGFTRRDYEGKISTLCAGCGHDSISAAIIQACWELDIQPHRVARSEEHTSELQSLMRI